MADKKISELTAATTLSSADDFVVVQSGTTNKIDASVIFGNVPVNIKVKETSEALTTDAAAATVGKRYVKLTLDAGGFNYTLAAGTHGAEMMFVVDTGTGTGVLTMAAASFAGTLNTITFANVGETAVVQNIDGLWYIKSLVGAIASAV